MLFQEPNIIRLDRGAKVHATRPAIDPMFDSAARLYGPRVVGAVLSGNGKDGAAGLRVIHNQGGLALAQDPTEASALECQQRPLLAIVRRYCPSRKLLVVWPSSVRHDSHGAASPSA